MSFKSEPFYPAPYVSSSMTILHEYKTLRCTCVNYFFEQMSAQYCASNSLSVSLKHPLKLLY